MVLSCVPETLTWLSRLRLFARKNAGCMFPGYFADCPSSQKIQHSPATPTYIPSTSRVRPEYIPSTSRVRPEYVPSTSRVRPSTFRVRSEYVPSTFRVHSKCVRSAAQCIPSACSKKARTFLAHPRSCDSSFARWRTKSEFGSLKARISTRGCVCVVGRCGRQKQYASSVQAINGASKSRNLAESSCGAGVRRGHPAAAASSHARGLEVAQMMAERLMCCCFKGLR